MTTKIFPFVNILVFAAWPALLAAPGGYTPLSVVLSSSDAIVAARIADGNISESDYSLTLMIDHIYKGPSDLVSIQVNGRVPSFVRARGPVGNTDRGLWFLRKGDGSRWEPVQIQSGAFIRGNYYLLPSSDIPRQGAGDTRPLIAKIAEEVADAIATNANSDEDVRRLAASLRGIVSPEISSVFERVLHSPSPRARLLAACILLRSHRAPSAMLEAERLLANGLSGHDRLALIDALYSFRDSEPQSVASAGRIATEHSDPDVRRAVAYSLSRIHTPTAVPFLVSLLDSKEAFIRAEAISGLSLFAAGIPIEDVDHNINAHVVEYRSEGANVRTARSDFDTDGTRRHFHRGNFANAEEEAVYVQFWKQWWIMNKQLIK